MFMSSSFKYNIQSFQGNALGLKWAIFDLLKELVLLQSH